MFVQIGGNMATEGRFLKTIIMTLAFSAVLISNTVCYAHSLFNDKYLVEYISMSEGLPANFIDYIYKDSSGFIWIATSGGGLSRYDGHDFLNLSAHSQPAISGNFISCLTEDRFHRLWIASENGLDILSLETMRTVSFTSPELGRILNKPVRFITTDAYGSVWMKYATTVYCITFLENGDISNVLEYADARMSLQENFLGDVENDGSVWTCYGREMMRIQEIDGQLKCKTIITDLPLDNDSYVSDCIIRNNEIWVATDRGLLRFDRTSGKLRHYLHSDTDQNTISQNFLTDLCISDDDQLLVSSLKGMNVYDSFNDNFQRINSDTNDLTSGLLSSDFINCIFTFDDQIWIGTESAGIIVIRPKLLSVRNYSHDDRDILSIAPNPVNAILTDASGLIWTGNVEGGLSWTVPGTEEFHHLTTQNSKLIHNSVSALECDNAGNMWIGTWGGGINIMSLEDKRFTANITATPDFPISYTGALKYDPYNNGMWIGSNVGVFYYDIDNETLAPVLQEQPHGCIGACIDDRQRLWLGCQEGLYVFDLQSKDEGNGDLFANRLISPGMTYTERISCVYISSDGTLWIGSNGNGIYRFDENEEDGVTHFKRFSSGQGLANDRVKGILDDNFGDIWISTDNGLSRFNQNTQTFTNYYTGDGLASSQFYWNASARMSDGSLCFGQTNGLTVVSPEKDNQKVQSFKLIFTIFIPLHFPRPG